MRLLPVRRAIACSWWMFVEAQHVCPLDCVSRLLCSLRRLFCGDGDWPRFGDAAGDVVVRQHHRRHVGPQWSSELGI